MPAEGLLAEFPTVSTEEWERMIRENLTGVDYASRLIWHPEEGLAIRPYYRSEDLADLSFINTAPGEFPYVRGTSATGDWRIREEVDVLDPEEANRAACRAIAAGAEETAFTGPRIESTSDIALLLANLNEIPIHFEHVTRGSVRLLIDRLKQKPHHAAISADLDPLTYLDFSAELIHAALPGFRPFLLHADEFHEMAAGAIEEIGFTLAAGVDFVAEMHERGLSISRIVESLGFSFAMGPDFFIQIAKLRAFRMIWAQAVESFGGTHNDARAFMHARTSRWNMTVHDPHVNILRATTEAISAVLGGAASISIAPFGECYKLPDEGSRRLARNTQLILKREALLWRVADPLGGSYLIEVLTNSIATKAWKLFQDLEAAGGYRKAQATGILSSILERRRAARDQSVEKRRLILTGANRFANPLEKIPNQADPGRMESVHRSAQPFERLRMRTERYVTRSGRPPHILLAEVGDPKMRRARSQFAADFFACAGLSSSTQKFERPEHIAEVRADLIVLCSSDAEYLPIAGEMLRILKERGSRASIVIAGDPASADQLRALGINEFIHIRSNAVEVLARLQQQIGIED